MIHNPYLQKGETCTLSYFEKNMWPQYLCVNIDIDENNWLFKNTNGFDLFTFILDEEKLISEKHLVFYNNLIDPDFIVKDISETDALNINELSTYDQVLMLDLNLLKIGQSIKIYCQFNEMPKVENRSILKKIFKKKYDCEIQTISGYFSFHFLDLNYNEWSWPSYGDGYGLNLCNELLEITKISEYKCKLSCIAATSDTSKEKMITRHLRTANSV